MYTNAISSILKYAEGERRKKEEAERKAKLDEIAERQRQRERELEEKERLRKEALLGRSSDGFSRPYEPPTREPVAAPAAAAAASGPTPGKYIPRHLRERTETTGQAPPPQPDRWGSGGRRSEAFGQPAGSVDADRRGGRRTDGFGSGSAAADSDRWGRGDSRPDDRPGGDRWRGSGGSSRPSWSSSRNPTR